MRNGSGLCLKCLIIRNTYSPLFPVKRFYLYFTSQFFEQNKHHFEYSKYGRKCFVWCIVASLHSVTKLSYIMFRSKKKQKMTGIDFVVSLPHLNKFETLNVQRFVNVFALSIGTDFSMLLIAFETGTKITLLPYSRPKWLPI